MFRRLSDARGEKRDLLTIRATEAWLRKDPERTLYVEIAENPDVITNSKEREEHFRTVSSSWFEKQSKEWRKPEVFQVEIADLEHPIEVLDTGIPFILEIEGKEYLVNCYRDIYNEGWVILGGCPIDLEEIFNPEAIALRELSEELLMMDARGYVYHFNPLAEHLLKENLHDWGLSAAGIIWLPIEKLTVPQKGDAQNLVLKRADQEKKIKNINIFIDYTTATITFVPYWKVKIPIPFKELKLFDCERGRDDRLLKRPIRLIDKIGETEVIFYSGQNILSATWNTPTIGEMIYFSEDVF